MPCLARELSSSHQCEPQRRAVHGACLFSPFSLLPSSLLGPAQLSCLSTEAEKFCHLHTQDLILSPGLGQCFMLLFYNNPLLLPRCPAGLVSTCHVVCPSAGKSVLEGCGHCLYSQAAQCWWQSQAVLNSISLISTKADAVKKNCSDSSI